MKYELNGGRNEEILSPEPFGAADACGVTRRSEPLGPGFLQGSSSSGWGSILYSCLPVDGFEEYRLGRLLAAALLRGFDGLRSDSGSRGW